MDLLRKLLVDEPLTTLLAQYAVNHAHLMVRLGHILLILKLTMIAICSRFGKMVACFRYASIDVHSVYLPPPKLDFNYENQEWIQQELNEV